MLPFVFLLNVMTVMSFKTIEMTRLRNFVLYQKTIYHIILIMKSSSSQVFSTSWRILWRRSFIVKSTAFLDVVNRNTRTCEKFIVKVYCFTHTDPQIMIFLGRVRSSTQKCHAEVVYIFSIPTKIKTEVFSGLFGWISQYQ